MQWSDEAIILKIHKFAEHGAVVSLFAREQGLYSGVCKSALSKAKRGIYQPGNIVQASWKARLEEHMGTVSAETDVPIAALVMQDRASLAGLNALCAMIPLAMHERDPHPELFDAADHVLRDMADGTPWQADYLRFELCLLREAGFRLDLSHCASTGVTENLVYISPKSGAAVSAEAGEPYKEKMLTLPAFFLDYSIDTPSPQDLATGWAATSFFLNKWLLDVLGRTMPQARSRLEKSFTELS